ncbi:hypothetical protein GCM10023215_19830 [Pseudonocardia yuanmonensis]|uniref:Uncharacterized protein n=1 Tax=Pseudonocardia yuanmonensis TaxID=1095914 RepID=A0ABP8WAE0_9PSEU
MALRGRPADVVHVHVGEHDVGDVLRCDARPDQVRGQVTGGEGLVDDAVPGAEVDQHPAVPDPHEEGADVHPEPPPGVERLVGTVPGRALRVPHGHVERQPRAAVQDG